MLRTANVMYGSDPEIFLKRQGKIIGSERVIPTEGLGTQKNVVIDGIQAELHPKEGITPLVLGHGIASCIRYLDIWLKEFPDVSVCWDQTVNVDLEEIAQLSDESQVLGCGPSENFYDDFTVDVDGATYPYRSAGGHIHLDLTATRIYNTLDQDERYRLPILDILVGNTMVLLDRDPNAALRRQNYGRAGEHRKPKWGIEYRVPSNFWLRNYTLLSLVCGLCNMAVAVVDQTISGDHDYEMDLRTLISEEEVIKAIQTNDFDLAMENFKKIRKFFVQHVITDNNSVHPIDGRNIDKFILFAESVKKFGLNTQFPTDPMVHWSRREFMGFRSFLDFRA